MVWNDANACFNFHTKNIFKFLTLILVLYYFGMLYYVLLFMLLFFCYFSRYFFFVLLENFQEYQEEFRDISGKSTKKLTGGSIADGNITLINQRHVGDDLPVWLFLIQGYPLMFSVKWDCLITSINFWYRVNH